MGTGAASFSASTRDHIQISTFTLGRSGLSFAFWFRANYVSQWARIFDFGNGAGNDNVVVAIDRNYLTAEVYKTPTSNLQKTNPWGSIVNDNSWRHAVWTIDSSGTWLTYLDGDLVSTYLYIGYPNNVALKYNYLARSSWTGDPYFTGEIDEFYVFNYVITASDVGALYYGENT